jgi:hypothetical protein
MPDAVTNHAEHSVDTHDTSYEQVLVGVGVGTSVVIVIIWP